jgi:ApaG protein
MSLVTASSDLEYRDMASPSDAGRTPAATLAKGQSRKRHVVADHLRPAMYQTVTHNIEVKVTPRYLPERSSQEKSYYFWAYTIEITNHGSETVQLKTRHWRITDSFGRLQEVKGAGVVGEEPVIEPGASFEYTSGVPLPTPSGFMTGSYGMTTDNGDSFDIDIPTFSLDSSDAKRTLN